MKYATLKSDCDRIASIGKRAARELRVPCFDTILDVSATHANGCPLDLDRLLSAPRADFAHDIYGISYHLDRETGRLRDFFLPRYAAKQEARS